MSEFASLDFSRALTNCHIDNYRDWYRDPWGWPELPWAAQQGDLKALKQRFNSSGAKRAAPLEVAKENFGTRPALVIDPLDRLVYQALVDKISVLLIGGLPSWVYGVRLEIRNPSSGTYGRGDYQWSYYRAHLKALAQLNPVGLFTDVVSFFASVPLDRLLDEVLGRAGETAVTRRLGEMLLSWSSIPGRGGLPQRYIPSSVLANFYLGPVDDVLREYGAVRAKRWRPHRALRWMDDIALFGRDALRLRRGQLDLQRVLRDLQLNVNLAKTIVLEDEDLQSEVQRREHSAADAGLSLRQPDPSELDALIDRLLITPEIADRTSVSFATHRMRRHRLFDRVPEFIEVADRMPHVGDALGRLFRDAGAWEDLGQWFVEYGRTHAGRIDWSVAQLGLMFPSGRQPPAVVADYLEGSLTQGHSLAMTALAAERLAKWDRERARLALREALPRSDSPPRRRVLALAGHTAGEGRAFLRDALNEFEENRVTLEMLQEMNFRRLKTTKDFDGR